MEAAQIRIMKRRGHMVVQATGLTPKGKTYVKAQKTLLCTSMASPRFKDEMASAVDELLGIRS